MQQRFHTTLCVRCHFDGWRWKYSFANHELTSKARIQRCDFIPFCDVHPFLARGIKPRRHQRLGFQLLRQSHFKGPGCCVNNSGVEETCAGRKLRMSYLEPSAGQVFPQIPGHD